MVKKILVALDGSPSSDKALDLAIQLARNSGASLLALAAIPAEPLTQADVDLALERYQPEAGEALVAAAFSPAPAQERGISGGAGKTGLPEGAPLRKAMAEHVLAAAKAAAQRQAFSPLETLSRSGDPATTILAVLAAESPDLLVMGSRGLGERAKNLLGGVSYKVMGQAACPVITVKFPDLED